MMRHTLGFYGHELVSEHHGVTEDGIFSYNSKVNFGQITDGSSNTLMIGERNSKDLEYPAFGNYRGWAWANRASARDNLVGVLEPINYKLPAGVGPNPSFFWTDKKFNSFSSAHPAGANFAMGDGSVQFLTLTGVGAQLELLQNLAVINDGMAYVALHVGKRDLSKTPAK